MKPIYNPSIATERQRRALQSLVVWAPCEYSGNGTPIRFHATIDDFAFLPKHVRCQISSRLAHLESGADVAAFNRSRLELAA